MDAFQYCVTRINFGTSNAADSSDIFSILQAGRNEIWPRVDSVAARNLGLQIGIIRIVQSRGRGGHARTVTVEEIRGSGPGHLSACEGTLHAG